MALFAVVVLVVVVALLFGGCVLAGFVEEEAPCLDCSCPYESLSQ